MTLSCMWLEYIAARQVCLIFRRDNMLHLRLYFAPFCLDLYKDSALHIQEQQLLPKA